MICFCSHESSSVLADKSTLVCRKENSIYGSLTKKVVSFSSFFNVRTCEPIICLEGDVQQVREEFFRWPRNTMAKKRSPDRSPVKLTSRAMKNVYEDSDSNRSEVIPRSKEGRRSSFDNDDGWRTDRKRGEDYSSDDIPYCSPVHDRRRERRNTHGGVHDEYYGRMGHLDRHHEGPSSSKLRRDRSPTADMSYRESRVRSVQGRGYDDREGRQYSWRETYSPTRRSPTTDDRHGHLKRVRSSPSRPVKRAKSSPSRAVANDVCPRSGGIKREKILKPIQVDGLGILVGMMKEQFSKDINSFVKEMNPCIGYEKQKQQAKDRLHRTRYTTSMRCMEKLIGWTKSTSKSTPLRPSSHGGIR